MSKNPFDHQEDLYDYLKSVSLREPEILKNLREETQSLPESSMQISPDQGQFMSLLVRLLKARKTLEIGTFTGYSSLSIALALPADGKIVACDVSDEWTSIARKYWKQAGVETKIDLRISPAAETLDTLLAEGHENSFDFAFIDADKASYEIYFEKCLQLVRQGGLIAIDNVFWGGRILDPEIQTKEAKSIRSLNEKLHTDDRIELSMLPVGDGLTLAWKK